jgi:hypothetical protein
LNLLVGRPGDRESLEGLLTDYAHILEELSIAGRALASVTARLR